MFATFVVGLTVTLVFVAALDDELPPPNIPLISFPMKAQHS